MNTIDIILLICFVPGIVRGFSKGFLEQVLSLGGMVLAVWMAFKFSGQVCEWLKPSLEMSETVLHVVAFALILIVISLGVLLLAKLLTKVVDVAMLGWLNKLLGMVLSMVVTGLVLGIIIVLVDTLNVKFGLIQSDILENSLLWGWIRDAAYFVFPYLKELLLKP